MWTLDKYACRKDGVDFSGTFRTHVYMWVNPLPSERCSNERYGVTSPKASSVIWMKLRSVELRLPEHPGGDLAVVVEGDPAGLQKLSVFDTI